LQTGAPTSYFISARAFTRTVQNRRHREQPAPGDLLFTWSTVHGAAALRVGNVAAAQGEVEHVGAEVVQRILRGIGAMVHEGPTAVQLRKFHRFRFALQPAIALSWGYKNEIFARHKL